MYSSAFYDRASRYVCNIYRYYIAIRVILQYNFLI